MNRSMKALLAVVVVQFVTLGVLGQKLRSYHADASKWSATVNGEVAKVTYYPHDKGGPSMTVSFGTTHVFLAKETTNDMKIHWFSMNRVQGAGPTEIWKLARSTPYVLRGKPATNAEITAEITKFDAVLAAWKVANPNMQI